MNNRFFDDDPGCCFTVRVNKDGELIIPDHVTRIGFGKCSGNKLIKTLIVPGSVKRICTRAFADCENLERVILHEGIEAIESYAFGGCKSLRRIEYPDSVTEYTGCTMPNPTGLPTPPAPRQYSLYPC